jgi:hypothetical protein
VCVCVRVCVCVCVFGIRFDIEARFFVVMLLHLALSLSSGCYSPAVRSRALGCYLFSAELRTVALSPPISPACISCTLTGRLVVVCQQRGHVFAVDSTTGLCEYIAAMPIKATV